MRRLVIAISVSLAAAAVAASAQLSEAVLDRDARDTIAAWHVPGLAIAVVQNDKVIFLKAYGIKEAGKSQPVTPDTLFEIGSTTKAFTATAMAMLAWSMKSKLVGPSFGVSVASRTSMVPLKRSKRAWAHAGRTQP